MSTNKLIEAAEVILGAIDDGVGSNVGVMRNDELCWKGSFLAYVERLRSALETPDTTPSAPPDVEALKLRWSNLLAALDIEPTDDLGDVIQRVNNLTIAARQDERAKVSLSWEAWTWAVAGRAAFVADVPVRDVRSKMAKRHELLEGWFKLGGCPINAGNEVAFMDYGKILRKP